MRGSFTSSNVEDLKQTPEIKHHRRRRRLSFRLNAFHSAHRNSESVRHIAGKRDDAYHVMRRASRCHFNQLRITA